MAISSKDIISLTHARTKLNFAKRCIRRDEKNLLRKIGYLRRVDGCNRLDHYHRLEREHLYLTLLEAALRGIEELAEGKRLTLSQLKTRHGR